MYKRQGVKGEVCDKTAFVSWRSGRSVGDSCGGHPYPQADVYKRQGLGLAITRSAVLMHRGAIKVFSTVGEGTIFNVRIPLNYIS